MLDARRSQQLMIAHPKGNDYQGALDILFTEALCIFHIAIFNDI